MIVVKLGGSLLSSGWLLPCLDKLEQSYADQKVIIVPGGGMFADTVRSLQQKIGFDDCTAHAMAIHAMQQTALLINSLKPGFQIIQSSHQIASRHNGNFVTLWSPSLAELDAAGIEPSWDTTSDSLSAWLAATVGAGELILVKSVTIGQNFDVAKLARVNIVDASLPAFVRKATFKLTIVHAQDFVA